MTPPQTLTESEIDRLLYWLKSDTGYNRYPIQRARDSLLGTLMADAGLRVSELVSLAPTQVLILASAPHNTHQPHPTPLTGLHLLPSHTKTNRSRTIPLTQRAQAAILNYYSHSPHLWRLESAHFLFPGTNHLHHLTTRQVRRIIDRAGRSTLHRPVHPHILRHTFATRIVRVSNTAVAQQLLGHASLSSTQVYVHPNADDCTTAINGLNKIPGAKP